MSFSAKKLQAPHSQFYSAGRDQIINYTNSCEWCWFIRWLSLRDPLKSASVFDILEKHTAIHAAYNSRERESEHASTCQEGTRKDVIEKISAWSRTNNDCPVCWLQGPAGSGKSTVAHTIAKQCADDQKLAFSFFFSRSKLDRSDTTKFIPTFAYQLAKSFPAIQMSMLRALSDDPSIPSQRLSDQIKKLIIDPILTTAESIPSMIVVIDGLDECGDALLQELIRLLVGTTNHLLPFRFLFTSRFETHIRQIFESRSTISKTYILALRDYNARDDIRRYLRLHLSEIRETENQLMRDEPRRWPSREDLETLVDKSEGLFIYVSTLVKFVADKNGLPQQKLQTAMTMHRGVDPLYDQVLSEARKFEYFERVIGAIIFLRRPLTVGEVGQLLQLPSNSIRLALYGCQSVLTIPDIDTESVRPCHASLRDFLIDGSRAKGHFLDPMKHHVLILVDCLKLIMTNMENGAEGGGHLDYACQNWCHHFSLVLLHQGSIGFIKSCFGDEVVTFIKNMEKQWSKPWMYKLGGFSAVETVCGDCDSVLARMVVSGMFTEL
jgi:hypothetical protein